TQRLLADALGAALGASDSLTTALAGESTLRREEPPPAAVMDKLRAGLEAAPGAACAGDDTLRLIEAIRVLAVRHGPAAVQHCTRLVESLRSLLDGVTGAADAAMR